MAVVGTSVCGPCVPSAVGCRRRTGAGVAVGRAVAFAATRCFRARHSSIAGLCPWGQAPGGEVCRGRRDGSRVGCAHRCALAHGACWTSAITVAEVVASVCFWSSRCACSGDAARWASDGLRGVGWWRSGRRAGAWSVGGRGCVGSRCSSPRAGSEAPASNGPGRSAVAVRSSAAGRPGVHGPGRGWTRASSRRPTQAGSDGARASCPLAHPPGAGLRGGARRAVLPRNAPCALPGRRAVRRGRRPWRPASRPPGRT